MKKLVFVFVAFAAISFASCGNKAANNGENVTEEVAVETVEEAASSEGCDSTAACCDSVAACCDSTKVVAE